MNIVILERDSVGTDIDISCFNKLGHVTSYANTVTADEVASRIADADIVIGNKAPVNEASLKNAPNVRFVALFATGYDNVDLDYCKKRGISVANLRNYCTASVAQHTFALALFLIEKLSHYDHYVKSGAYGAQHRFSNFDVPFTELNGKTWGIIGMGNIGKTVARIAAAFGCRVIFYSASGNSTCTDYPRTDFETLLKESDILSLHCPLSDRTRHIINLDAMKLMKPSAILINVARGAVVNNHDLYTALTENIIAAAGLDVLEQEPIAADNPLGRIKDSTKLVITPHLAWAGTEARQRCVSETFENIKAFLEGRGRNLVSH